MKTTSFAVVFLFVLFIVQAAFGQEGESAESDDDFLNPDKGSEAESEPAEAEQNGEEDPPSEDRKMIRDHHLQGVFNVLIGTGWFIVFPYEKNDPDRACGETEESEQGGGEFEGEPFCTGRSGFHLDFTGGFGVLPGFEVYAVFRLGIEQPGGELMNQPKTRQIGAGVRIYSPSDGLFKIGFGIAPLFDFSDHGSGADIGKDFVIHVPIQAHFDINRWFGAYAQVAPNFSFVSEFRLELTGGIGVQGRFI